MKNARFLKTVTLNLVFIIFHSQGLHSQTPDSLINKDSIRSVVEFLASDSLLGRFTGTDGALTAANYIANEFRIAGLKEWDSTNNYFFPFSVLGGTAIGYNVMGVLPGQDHSVEVVIFSAHYDHVGTLSTNPYREYNDRKTHAKDDSIFNGANDNASGTAALISLARYYGSVRNNKRTILFVAFSGEELGLKGSTALASSITQPSSVVCMINLEMLGRGDAPFITGSQLGNLRPILNKELARGHVKEFGKHYFNSEPFLEQKLFTRSDNYPFALFRIPAYTIMGTTDLDEYYHTVDDEPKTLDYERIQRITIAIRMAMDPIINKGVLPWKIDPANYRDSSSAH